MADSRSSLRARDDALRYLEAFRRHWVLIVVLVVAAVGAAAVASYAADEKYEARADVLITPIEEGDDTFRGITLFRRGVTSASAVILAGRVLSSEEIYATTYRRLGERGSGVSIGLEPLSQADVLVVKATAKDPDTAALAANTFAEVAVENRTAAFQAALRTRIANLERRADAVPEAERNGNFEYATMRQQLGELKAFVGAPDPTLTLLQPATAPGAPSWPRTKLAIMVALAVALLIGAGVAVALEFLNPRVMREEDIPLVDRLPILARIPRFDRRQARLYLAGSTTLPAGSWNGYRTLRAVLGAAGGAYPRSILVTSATPGDGKTMTAVNLAITLATANVRVILVDADPFRPMVATAFHVTQRDDGLARLLAGRSDVAEALVPAGRPPGLQLVLSPRRHVPYIRTPARWASSASVPKWTVVEEPHGVGSTEEARMSPPPAPTPLPTAEHLLTGDRITSVLERLGEHADVVVIDSPPLTEVAETLAIAESVDAILVAVRLGHTQREKLEQLLDLLARRNVPPVGFVVTGRDAPKPYFGYSDGVPDLAGGLQQWNVNTRRARDSAQ